VILIKKLVTVKVLYEIPDYTILNTFLWQTNDMVPELPRVKKFLTYWDEHIDAQIREVMIAHSHLRDWSKVDLENWYGL